MKACIVIPVYFGARRRTFKCVDDVIDLVKYSIENYRNLDPGVETDIIFVNNTPEVEKASELLSDINETPTKRGIFRILDGDNVGISFGAFDNAFKNFKDDYDLWCFTEDDIIPNLDGFLDIAAKQLEDETIGFLGLIGIHPSKNMPHAHGGTGCTTRDRIQSVVDVHGCLPHHKDVPKEQTTEYFRAHIRGEQAFTKCFADLGFQLTKIATPVRPYIRWDAYDTPHAQKIDQAEWGSFEAVHMHL